MHHTSRHETKPVPAFSRVPGAAPLDAAAFGTRIFKHQPRNEAPAAFVVAPAFVWNGLVSGRTGPASHGCAYTVLGVYSVDERTLEIWRARGLVRGDVRVFDHPAQAVSFAEYRNHEVARQYFEDLKKGDLTHVGLWKAVAVETFRVLPIVMDSPSGAALAS